MIQFELISGITFGLEHVQADYEEDGIHYLICLHLGFFRITYIKY
jgi:hypothetical protein